MKSLYNPYRSTFNQHHMLLNTENVSKLYYTHTHVELELTTSSTPTFNNVWFFSNFTHQLFLHFIKHNHTNINLR